MSDGKLESIKTTIHRIELAENGLRLVHCTRYRIAVTARQFVWSETDWKLQEEVVKSASIQGASPIVFVPEKKRLKLLFVVYQTCSVVMFREFFSLSTVDKCIDLWHKVCMFPSSGPSVVCWKVDINECNFKKPALVVSKAGIKTYRFHLNWKALLSQSKVWWALYYRQKSDSPQS